MEAFEDRTVPATFVVSLTTDTGLTGSLVTPLGPGTPGDLRNAIFQAVQDPTDADIIDLRGVSGTIALSAMLPPIFTTGSGSLTILGPGASNLTISGQDAVRPFFILQGEVSISDLTIAHGLAQGGAGANGGGGGAGMGGGLLIDGTTGATTVTLTNVTFDGNQAVGGAGASGGGSANLGGGGGAGGNGGSVAGGGAGGGGGFLGAGGSAGGGATAGGGGGFTGTGGTGGGNGTDIGGGGGNGPLGGTGGTGSTGGGDGAARVSGIGSSGGGGGIDVSGFPVHSTGTDGQVTIAGLGGAGGFGGGGSGGTASGGRGGDYGGGGGGGGAGGFGGGGGFGAAGAGAGGFGGGGGGWAGGIGGPGAGGGGLGGAGSVGQGGGGAGLGGAVFQRAGTLYLNTITFTNNSAVGAGNGAGSGGAIFLYTGATAEMVGTASAFSGNTAALNPDVTGSFANPVATSAGTPQGTTFNTAFAAPLTVTVTDSHGNPLVGAVVTFTAPTSGAAATLSSSTAVTDATGRASVTATANGTPGAFTVTASTGGNSVAFNLQNLTTITLTIIAGTPQSTVLNTAFAVPLIVTATDDAGNPVPGAAVTFTAPASGPSATLSSTSIVTRLTGLAVVTAAANGTPGAFTITASTSALGASVRSASFSLTNALSSGPGASSTVTTVTAPGGTYNGAPYSATVTVNGTGAITGTPTVTYFDHTTSTDLGTTAPINAGRYTVTATYPGDATHTGSSGTATFDILKAPSTTTTVGAGPFVSDGSTHGGGSGTVTGVGGLSAGATSLTYTGDRINAGTYFVTAHFAGDANHLPSDGAAVAITITLAPGATDAFGGTETPIAYLNPVTGDRSRALANLSVQQRFVQALYLDVLGRAGSVAELNGWLAVLNGTPNGQAGVAQGIENSAEGRHTLVAGWYRTYLGRSVNGTEDQGHVSALLAGASEEAVLGGILGSAEFVSRAQTLVGSGSTQERYVQALYEVLLGRVPAAGEIAGHSAAVNGREGHVAVSFLRAPEFRAHLVTEFYSVLLNRPIGAGELNGRITAAQNAYETRLSIERSPEFFANG